MASETVKRSFKPGPGSKPVAWRLEDGWLFRQDEAVMHLPEVTKGSWFAGQKPRGLPHHELVLQSPTRSVRIRAHGAHGSSDTQEMRRLVVKAMAQVQAVAPEATFRVGADPTEMAVYFVLGIFLVGLAGALLVAGQLLGLVPLPLGVYLAWKWRPWTARLRLSAADVLAELRNA